MRENVKSLTLRLSAEEYARLCRLAELSGLKLEPTVRSLIMGAQLRRFSGSYPASVRISTKSPRLPIPVAISQRRKLTPLSRCRRKSGRR